MTIALIVVSIVAIWCLALNFVSRLVAKRGRERFDKISQEELRKHQETMYKIQQMG